MHHKISLGGVFYLISFLPQSTNLASEHLSQGKAARSCRLPPGYLSPACETYILHDTTAQLLLWNWPGVQFLTAVPMWTGRGRGRGRGTAADQDFIRVQTEPTAMWWKGLKYLFFVVLFLFFVFYFFCPFVSFFLVYVLYCIVLPLRNERTKERTEELGLCMGLRIDATWSPRSWTSRRILPYCVISSQPASQPHVMPNSMAGTKRTQVVSSHGANDRESHGRELLM